MKRCDTIMQFLGMTKPSWMSDAEILFWIEDFLLNLYTQQCYLRTLQQQQRDLQTL